jgi:hypothetical protein
MPIRIERCLMRMTRTASAPLDLNENCAAAARSDCRVLAR